MYIPDTEFGRLATIRNLYDNTLNNISDKSVIERWVDKFYFSICTGTTVGFGDIYPNTIRLKGIITLHIILTFILFVY